MQKESYHEEQGMLEREDISRTSSIFRLSSYLDGGILSAKGQLQEANMTKDTRYYCPTTITTHSSDVDDAAYQMNYFCLLLANV